MNTANRPMRLPRLSYVQKLVLVAAVPLVLAVAAISALVAVQARELTNLETAALQTQLIEAKKRELKNYISLARTAISEEYGRALPDDEEAKEQVIQTLAAMLYGQDGFIFVYDYDGKNLVAPRQTELINRDWTGLTDANGTPVVDELIRIARAGAGYHSYEWTKPSTGEKAQMVSYVIGLQDWRWALGTGIFTDDVLAKVAIARTQMEKRIDRTFVQIAAITLAALVLVFLSGLVLNIRERRLADTKLKALTQRVFDTQEEERGRVARELHDSVSQMLVGVRYMLELARKRLRAEDARAEQNLDAGIEAIGSTIQEVRRISHDLRPGVLDDLGLGPALQALLEDFGKRTGIQTKFESVVFRNRVDQEAKIALYRIAQEALTNIERHAGADLVTLKLYGHTKGATMRISDNGKGIGGKGIGGKGIGGKAASGAAAAPRVSGGLGLRNMQERIERLDGALRVISSQSGTTIDAQIPLSHMLRPEFVQPTNGPLPKPTEARNGGTTTVHIDTNAPTTASTPPLAPKDAAKDAAQESERKTA